MKQRKGTACSIFILGLLAVYLTVYTIFVTPQRFFQCLDAPLVYLTRDDKDRELAFPAFQEGHAVKLLVNGSEALPEILDLIGAARTSVQYQVMLFHPDQAGESIAAALESAARRGVKIQLSFDQGQTTDGSIVAPHSEAERQELRRETAAILQRLEAAGAVVLDSRPGIDYPLEGVSQAAAQVQAGIAGSSCISANHYDHRKLLIIDGSTAIIGGMNVGNAYLYQLPPDLEQDMRAEAENRRQNSLEGWDKWQDVAVLVQGPVVEEMVKEFNWRWEILGGQPLPEPENAPPAGSLQAHFAANRPGYGAIGSGYFHLIEQAQSEIYVASPYVSYGPLLKALADAGERGVRVVFVVPDQYNDIEISRRIFQSEHEDLLEAGIELYQNDLRMTHSKVMVVDGRWAVIGSFNLNYRSFRHDLETALFVDNPSLASEVIGRVFEPYLAQSVRVLEPEPVPWTMWSILDWIFRPFS